MIDKRKGRLVGTSVEEFFERFPDAEACEQHLASVRWGRHKACEICGEAGGWKKIVGTTKFYHTCGAQASPRKDTIFYRSNLSLMAWFYALLLFANSSHGMRSAFIRKQLGIGVKSAHRMCNEIRTHFCAYDRPTQLGGPGKIVQVDEALVFNVVDKWGRSSPVIVMGIACEGAVLCGTIKDRTSATLIRNIERYVAPGSRIITDGYKSYSKLFKHGWSHGIVNHSRAFHNFYGETTTDIDAFWSVLKRTMLMYRQAAEYNFWRFLGEVEFRYNMRLKSSSIFETVISFFPDIRQDTIEAIRRRYVWTE